MLSEFIIHYDLFTWIVRGSQDEASSCAVFSVKVRAVKFMTVMVMMNNLKNWLIMSIMMALM